MNHMSHLVDWCRTVGLIAQWGHYCKKSDFSFPRRCLNFSNKLNTTLLFNACAVTLAQISHQCRPEIRIPKSYRTKNCVCITTKCYKSAKQLFNILDPLQPLLLITHHAQGARTVRTSQYQSLYNKGRGNILTWISFDLGSSASSLQCSLQPRIWRS